MLRKTFWLSVVVVAGTAGILAIGCSNKKEEPTSSPSKSLTAEAQLMAKARTAVTSAGSNSNGLLKGTGMTTTLAAKIGSLSASLNPETDCSHSGWPASGNPSDTGYVIKAIYCSLMKSPDGPDTVRGGLDRVAGFLCALGDITYDGTTRGVPMSITTECFSQTFVDMAKTETGQTVPTITWQVTGHSSVTGVGPASYDKYLTMSSADFGMDFTILIKDGTTEKAAAIMYGLPSTASGSVRDVFAIYMNSTTGVVRYEGRFQSNSGNPVGRHIRAEIGGTMNSSFELTDVQHLHFVHGELSNGSNNGFVYSLSGTPAAGRRIHTLSTNDFSTGPTWAALNVTDDDSCVGETGATCTGNTGISPTGTAYFLGSGHTAAKTWFTTNSYLGGVTANSVDMDDLWN